MVGSDGSSGNSSKFQHNHMMMSSQHDVIPEISNSPNKSGYFDYVNFAKI